MMEVLKTLIEDLRLNHEYCPKEVILQAADELERLAQRTWVGLTDDEHCDIWYKESLDWMEYGKAIEAKLKEKNT
jgi:hypothetical protein